MSLQSVSPSMETVMSHPLVDLQFWPDNIQLCVGPTVIYVSKDDAFALIYAIRSLNLKCTHSYNDNFGFSRNAERVAELLPKIQNEAISEWVFQLHCQLAVTLQSPVDYIAQTKELIRNCLTSIFKLDPMWNNRHMKSRLVFPRQIQIESERIL